MALLRILLVRFNDHWQTPLRSLIIFKTTTQRVSRIVAKSQPRSAALAKGPANLQHPLLPRIPQTKLRRKAASESSCLRSEDELCT